MGVEEATKKAQAVLGDINSIENLIDEIAVSPSVHALCGEIQKIIDGEEPIKDLLAFVPMIARFAYDLIERDGKRGDEIEQIVKVIIGLFESKMAV